jgi:hypothetical protein
LRATRGLTERAKDNFEIKFEKQYPGNLGVSGAIKSVYNKGPDKRCNISGKTASLTEMSQQS